MTRRRLRKPWPVLALGALLGQPAVAQMEGPVEQGLAQLASQIVARSTAAGKTTIAVLPFPNADGSCSVLSNFVADELIQRLFAVPGSQLQIVERAQLETVINELRLGTSGLLNPETTRRLGSQSGVSALTVGTITPIGDRVRINARLIATDSGMAISAAAVDIPKVAAVSELLGRPVTTGPICAPRSIGPNTVAPSSSPGQAGTLLDPASPTATRPRATFTAQSHGFDIQGRCRRSGGTVICDLTIINQEAPRQVFLHNGARIFDRSSQAYQSIRVSLASRDSRGNYAFATLLQGLRAQGAYYFENVSASVSEIYLFEFHISDDRGSNFKIEISQPIPIT